MCYRLYIGCYILHIIIVFLYFSLLLQEEHTNTSDVHLGITTGTTDVHGNMRHLVNKEQSFPEDICALLLALCLRPI